MPPRLRGALILTVTSVWALNMLAPIVTKDYEPSPEANTAFMAILAVLIAGTKKPPPTDPPDTDP